MRDHGRSQAILAGSDNKWKKMFDIGGTVSGKVMSFFRILVREATGVRHNELYSVDSVCTAITGRNNTVFFSRQVFDERIALCFF